MTTLIIVENEDEMGRKAADIIGGLIRNKPDCVLGLATGSTPLTTYKYMIEDYKNSLVSYEKVMTFNLDEYVGLEAHEENSYHYYMNHNLFNHIDIKKENVNIPCGVSDLEETSKNYHHKINENPIDLQLLGLGSNGHIGFNEPGVDFESTVHVVDLDSQTIEDNMRFFDSIDHVPTKAITMGIKDIMSARQIVLLVNNEKKLDAMQAILKGPVDNNCPGTILRNHKNLTIIALSHLFKNVIINK